MPATTLHCVVSITDCIATGKHAIPVSNVTNCVLITLHNALVSSITTNADHEPARRFLIRIFLFIALAFTDPLNETADADDSDKKVDGEAYKEYQQCRQQRPMPSRMLQHLPDLATSNGVLDVLALRSFVVLFMALTSSAYPYQVETTHCQALPVSSDVWEELLFAWTMALNLDEYLSEHYTFKRLQESGPESIEEAADVSSSQTQYHQTHSIHLVPANSTYHGRVHGKISCSH